MASHKLIQVFPSPKSIDAGYELNRDKLHAVKFVGQGEFGKVFLATWLRPAGHAAAADNAVRINVGNDDDDDDDDGGGGGGGKDEEVQVAVKTVLPTVAPKGVREFTEEASDYPPNPTHTRARAHIPPVLSPAAFCGRIEREGTTDRKWCHPLSPLPP